MIRKKWVLSILIIPITILLKSTNVYATTDNNPFGIFKNDGTFEYDYGLNYVLSNTHDDPALTGPEPWQSSDPNANSQTITTTNRRDHAVGLHNDDRRGWSYNTSIWLDYATYRDYMRYGTDSVGINEYLDNSYDPVRMENTIQGVQDGGAKIYTSDGYTWNQYRKAVMMLYKRELPSPAHVSTIIGFPNGFPNNPFGYHTYSSGSDLWSPANINTSITTTDADLYKNDYGQNAQWQGRISVNEFQIKSTNDNSQSVNIDRYCDYYNQWLEEPWQGSYWSDNRGENIIKSLIQGDGYNQGNPSVDYAGLLRHQQQSVLTICPTNGLDLDIATNCKNKYGRWGAGYDGFDFNGNNYTRLKIDGDAPAYAKYEIKNVNSNGYDVYVYGVKDDRSGVDKLLFPTWTKEDQSDIRWDKGTDLGNGTYYYHVDSSLFNGYKGKYNTHVYLIDNVGNYTAVTTSGATLLKIDSLKINEVMDPEWKKVFRGDDNTVTGYMFDKLPVDNTSNPIYTNADIKKGYNFAFCVAAEGLTGDNDKIEIIPTLYYWDGTKRIPVDMYYTLGLNPFIKMGSQQDDVEMRLYYNYFPLPLNDFKINPNDDSYYDIGSFSKVTLNKDERTVSTDGSTQYFWGIYQVPATAIFTPVGVSPRPENLLKKNHIIVHFDVKAIPNNDYSSAVQFTFPAPKSSLYEAGDVLQYNNALSVMDDFDSKGIY